MTGFNLVSGVFREASTGLLCWGRDWGLGGGGVIQFGVYLGRLLRHSGAFFLSINAQLRKYDDQDNPNHVY